MFRIEEKLGSEKSGEETARNRHAQNTETTPRYATDERQMCKRKLNRARAATEDQPNSKLNWMGKFSRKMCRRNAHQNDDGNDAATDCEETGRLFNLSFPNAAAPNCFEPARGLDSAQF
ncbi:unnamed protein product [Hermetia illucens]|uniref:Uncharacterized protein n=1 Tax=Hermetia illucens TaxID=343691 RepID=A0A7R8V3Y3_HERIL|nr:unnamed protein product [Hermetia illucens]